MALDATKLSAVAYGAGQTLYLYQTNDTATQIATAGYFDSLVDQLRVGDVIIAVNDLDGTPAVDVFAVTANDGSAVTVVNGT